DDAILHLERGVCRVVAGHFVAAAFLVDSLGDVCRADTRKRFDPSEQALEYVLPVRKHVENDAAAILRAIVPRRALRLLPVTLEHPVSELATHREDASEEAAVDEALH